ncbi:MAG: hypothetical protein KAG43_06430, partial [Candidatus Marithrix sp.]|nr:hypothetical protein [Candidatus Marithrix sp.]
INAQQIKMVDGATIICASYGSGQCGDLNIKATKSISLLGASKGNYIRAGLPFIKQPTTISTTAHHGVGGQLNVESDQIDMIGSIISTSSLGVGNSGDVRINAGTLNATDGSLITSSGLSSGQAGNIDINVKNTLSLSRRRVGSFITPTGIKFENNRSNISSFGMIGKGGNISISAQTFKIDKEGFISASILGRVTAETSGKITIKTDNLSISQGGLINNSNGIFLGGKFHVGAGHGGSIEIQAKNIDIDVDQSDLPTGIFSNTYSKSNGGDIKIQTDSLNVINDGTISARSNATGNSGSIAIQADIIKLTNQGKISTEAKNAVGGNIVVKTPNLLYLHKAAIITSVGTGEGKGGDITITSPVFVVMDGGIIKAQADVGHGGNINIESEQFITSPDSLISASSRLGIDGEVKIESPNVDMESFLVILSDDAVDASRLIQKPCRMRGGSFFVQKINGSPQTPYDYQPSTYLPETNGEVTKISMNPEKKIALSTCKNF